MGNAPLPYREGEAPPSDKHILARLVNEDDGAEQLVWLDPADLHQVPPRHEDVDELLPAVRWTWRNFGQYIESCRSLEDWELGFMRDAGPHQELALWVRAVYAYLEFANRHPEVDGAVLAQAIMCMLSGREDLIEPPTVADNLQQLMSAPPEALTDIENFTADGRFILGPAHLE